MPRLALWLIVIATLAIGAPYAALVLNVLQGPWSATGVERDGSITEMRFDRSMARPSWMPVPPDAAVVDQSHLINTLEARDYQSLEVTSHRSLAELRRFYIAHLRAAGFSVTDLGTLNLNARAADYLGIGDTLSATRKSSGDAVNITIGTPEGVFGARLVQLGWWKNAVRV
jgi:hypothetical protein